VNNVIYSKSLNQNGVKSSGAEQSGKWGVVKQNELSSTQTIWVLDICLQFIVLVNNRNFVSLVALMLIFKKLLEYNIYIRGYIVLLTCMFISYLDLSPLSSSLFPLHSFLEKI
jgi:hypothetical protein